MEMTQDQTEIDEMFEIVCKSTLFCENMDNKLLFEDSLSTTGFNAAIIPDIKNESSNSTQLYEAVT